MRQSDGASFGNMIDNTLCVHHSRGERPAGHSKARFSVYLSVEAVESHLCNSVGEGALLRVVSHRGAQVEDPALAADQGGQERLSQGQGSDQVDLQGVLKVGEVYIRQTIRISDGCVLHQKSNAGVRRKSCNQLLPIRVLSNVRLDDLNIAWVARRCFCFLKRLQPSSTSEDLVGLAEMLYNGSSYPGSSSGYNDPKTTCHCE